MKINPFQLARDNFRAYILMQWPKYEMNWHHAKIADALEDVCKGKIKRLIIEAPPRHGKSLLTSEYFPAWYLGHHPNREIIFATHSQTLANRFGRKVRNQLLSFRFQKTFSNCSLSQDSKSKHEFATIQGGEYHAIGIEGGASGKGAHLAVLDDTLKGREQADSELFREKIKEFFRSSIYTRLPPDGTGAIVIMQTRWHQDDLIGYVLAEHADENWTRICLPAYVDEKETQPLWPKRFPKERLDKIKLIQGIYNWNSLYLQRPSAKEGNILKNEWWQYYTQLPEKIDCWLQSWDLAFKGLKTSDFVVGTIWAVVGPNAYLVDLRRGRWGFTEAIEQILLATKQYPKAYTKLVEDKANGAATEDQLKKDIPGVILVDPKGGKISRANAVTPFLRAGNVLLPKASVKPWVANFVDECSNFPNGSNDDQVDSMTQALLEIFDSSIQKMKKFLQM